MKTKYQVQGHLNSTQWELIRQGKNTFTKKSNAVKRMKEVLSVYSLNYTNYHRTRVVKVTVIAEAGQSPKSS